MPIAVLIFFSLFFAGCKHNSQAYMQMDESLIRVKIENYERKLVWSQEIRPNGLENKKLEIPLDELPKSLIFYRRTGEVYPSIEGFGSLNTSELPSEIFDLLDGFFASAAIPPPESRIIDKDYLKDDLEFLPFVLERHFAEIPEVSQMIYGEPTKLGKRTWQIPVRLANDKQHADLDVFVSAGGLSYSIEQIQFGQVAND